MSLFKKIFSESESNVPDTKNIDDSTHNHDENHGDTRLYGKIIKVSKDGYGFISSKDIPFTRIFFHWSALKNDTKKFTELRTGMKVSFVSFEDKEKGYRAIKIRIEE